MDFLHSSKSEIQNEKMSKWNFKIMANVITFANFAKKIQKPMYIYNYKTHLI